MASKKSLECTSKVGTGGEHETTNEEEYIGGESGGEERGVDNEGEAPTKGDEGGEGEVMPLGLPSGNRANSCVAGSNCWLWATVG